MTILTIIHKRLEFDEQTREYVVRNAIGMEKHRFSKDAMHFLSNDPDAGTITVEVDQ